MRPLTGTRTILGLAIFIALAFIFHLTIEVRGATHARYPLIDESVPHVVKDIEALNKSSEASHLVEFNGLLYFTADIGNGWGDEYHAALWRSDGTVEGTLMVVDVQPNHDQAYLLDLTVMGGSLYMPLHGGEQSR